MGTPDFAGEIIEHLVKNGFFIAAVFSQPDKPKGRGKKTVPTPSKTVAEKFNIPVYQPKSLIKENSYSLIQEINPDIILTAAYGKLLRENIISVPKYGSWNIHASLLPKYRGAAPIQRAIENGEKETGVSVFRIVPELDAGPVAVKKSFEISVNDNFENVFNKTLELSKKLIVDFLNNFDSYTPEEQIHEESTYAEKIKDEDLIIDFSQNSETLHNKIRAFDPVPGTKIKLKDETVKIFGSEMTEKTFNRVQPGYINVLKNEIFAETGNGWLKINKIQFPGKKIINTSDAVNGRKILNGDIFVKI